MHIGEVTCRKEAERKEQERGKVWRVWSVKEREGIIPSVSLKKVLANSVAPPLLNVSVKVAFTPAIHHSLLHSNWALKHIICTLIHVLSCDIVRSKYWLMDLKLA